MLQSETENSTPETSTPVVDNTATENAVAETSSADAPQAAKVNPETSTAGDTASDDGAQEVTTGFGSLGLSDGVVATLDGHGYDTPTPIQAETIPLLLSGRDVLGQAQTGTGKTAAFALPLLQRIDIHKKQPQILVLTPTRELAIQVAESFEKYGRSLGGLRVLPIYGGQDYQIQLRPLKKGVHVVVGTPGRVMDHMRKGSLNLDDLQCLVLDEADEMLRMGFAEDVDWVLTQAPADRQMALFSATMPGPIRKIAQQHLKNPENITIAQKSATADTVNQRYLVAAPHQKQAALVRILEAEPTDGVLVFCKTRATTEPLTEELTRAGFKTAALSGDVAQKQRERIVDSLRRGRIDIIVATDVAARGLDVDRISHVINYDLPHDHQAYVHRIGRTGRAGRSGEAILFVHPRERRALHRLEQAMRKTIAVMELPSNRDVNKQRVARFHDKITAALGHPELETFEAIVEHYRRENDVPIELIAAALATMANGSEPLLVKKEIKVSGFNSGGGSGHGKGSSRHESPGRGRDLGHHRSSPMQSYRIEVGRKQKVEPKHIVGAITNEAGITNASIGKIKIFDHFSTVDLPAEMPTDVMATIENISVAGCKLRISRNEGGPARSSGYQAGKRGFEKSKGKGKPRYGKKAGFKPGKRSAK